MISGHRYFEWLAKVLDECEKWSKTLKTLADVPRALRKVNNASLKKRAREKSESVHSRKRRRCTRRPRNFFRELWTQYTFRSPVGQCYFSGQKDRYSVDVNVAQNLHPQTKQQSNASRYGRSNTAEDFEGKQSPREKLQKW